MENMKERMGRSGTRIRRQEWWAPIGGLTSLRLRERGLEGPGMVELRGVEKGETQGLSCDSRSIYSLGGRQEALGLSDLQKWELDKQANHTTTRQEGESRGYEGTGYGEKMYSSGSGPDWYPF